MSRDAAIDLGHRDGFRLEFSWQLRIGRGGGRGDGRRFLRGSFLRFGRGGIGQTGNDGLGLRGSGVDEFKRGWRQRV